jgi:hypothetical protein
MQSTTPTAGYCGWSAEVNSDVLIRSVTPDDDDRRDMRNDAADSRMSLSSGLSASRRVAVDGLYRRNGVLLVHE